MILARMPVCSFHRKREVRSTLPKPVRFFACGEGVNRFEGVFGKGKYELSPTLYISY